MRKYNWKKILINTFWILAGVGTIVLLGAAMQKKNQKQCTDIKIEITGVERHMFIDEKDVREILNASGKVTGSAISSLNLREMETVVERNPWVKNAEMFLDNNQILQVKIEERQPVARVFTLEGNSFYVDSAALRLPLSEKLSARVPIFTGFPSGKEKLARPDSALLKNIVRIGNQIIKDSFWMAQVAQIDITPQAGFEMVPVMGDHVVVLGDAENLEKKFTRLYTFYQKAWLQNGINTYEKLDVQYDNQVVAIKKGTGKALVDSVRAHQLMQSLMVQRELLDSNNAAKPVLANPPKLLKDSIVKTKSVSTLTKETDNLKSTINSNNKTAIKPLTNGKKVQAKKILKKKPGVKKKEAKAVMEKKA